MLAGSVVVPSGNPRYHGRADVAANVASKGTDVNIHMGFPEVFCQKGEICLLLPFGPLAVTTEQVTKILSEASTFRDALRKALAQQEAYRTEWKDNTTQFLVGYGEVLAVGLEGNDGEERRDA